MQVWKAELKGDYIGAALTTCEWVRNLLEPDGSFAGSEGSIAGFYKAPRAFETAGFVPEADEEIVVRDTIPRLKQAGARGIVEYQLSKIIE